MESIRQYILAVVCMAILCGLTQHIFPEKTVVKLITGLMITVTVIGPLLRDKVISVDTYFDEIAVSSEWVVSEGEASAMKTRNQIIKEKTQTYILDKAAQMGVQIEADITLSMENPPMPEGVTVKGSISPYLKKQLSECLSCELGISEDQQIWIS